MSHLAAWLATEVDPRKVKMFFTIILFYLVTSDVRVIAIFNIDDPKCYRPLLNFVDMFPMCKYLTKEADSCSYLQTF